MEDTIRTDAEDSLAILVNPSVYRSTGTTIIDGSVVPEETPPHLQEDYLKKTHLKKYRFIQLLFISLMYASMYFYVDIMSSL